MHSHNSFHIIKFDETNEEFLNTTEPVAIFELYFFGGCSDVVQNETIVFEKRSHKTCVKKKKKKKEKKRKKMHRHHYIKPNQTH